MKELSGKNKEEEKIKVWVSITDFPSLEFSGVSDR